MSLLLKIKKLYCIFNIPFASQSNFHINEYMYYCHRQYLHIIPLPGLSFYASALIGVLVLSHLIRQRGGSPRAYSNYTLISDEMVRKPYTVLTTTDGAMPQLKHLLLEYINSLASGRHGSKFICRSPYAE